MCRWATLFLSCLVFLARSLLAAVSEEGKKEYLGKFLLVGNSQCGKSSFINLIAGKQVAEVGDGSGQSVTFDSILHRVESSEILGGHSIDLIDFPGFGDTRLKFSDDKLEELLRDAIFEHLDIVYDSEANEIIQRDASTGHLNGVIVFESISGSADSLKRVLTRLRAILHQTTVSHCLCLITKIDSPFFDDDEKAALIRSSMRYAALFKMKGCKWTNTKTELNSEMVEELITGLIGLQPVTLNSLSQVIQKINEEVQRLYKEQPRRTAEMEVPKADIKIRYETVSQWINTMRTRYLSESEIQDKVDKLYFSQEEKEREVVNPTPIGYTDQKVELIFRTNEDYHEFRRNFDEHDPNIRDISTTYCTSPPSLTVKYTRRNPNYGTTKETYRENSKEQIRCLVQKSEQVPETAQVSYQEPHYTVIKWTDKEQIEYPELPPSDFIEKARRNIKRDLQNNPSAK